MKHILIAVGVCVTVANATTYNDTYSLGACIENAPNKNINLADYGSLRPGNIFRAPDTIVPGLVMQGAHAISISCTPEGHIVRCAAIWDVTIHEASATAHSLVPKTIEYHQKPSLVMYGNIVMSYDEAQQQKADKEKELATYNADKLTREQHMKLFALQQDLSDRLYDTKESTGVQAALRACLPNLKDATRSVVADMPALQWVWRTSETQHITLRVSETSTMLYIADITHIEQPITTHIYTRTTNGYQMVPRN